jgi:hypothetical protein
VIVPPLARLRCDEKHYRQLPHRLGAPLIREVLARFCSPLKSLRQAKAFGLQFLLAQA